MGALRRVQNRGCRIHPCTARHKGAQSIGMVPRRCKALGDEMGMWTGRSEQEAPNHSRPRDCNAESVCQCVHWETGKADNRIDPQARRPALHRCITRLTLNTDGVFREGKPDTLFGHLARRPPLTTGPKGTDMTAAGLTLAATPALAHHPLNGMPMETFSHGLLSGVGHPLLGFDHLFFVIAVGIAALFTARRFAAPAAYVGAMLLGCALMAAGIALPLAETVIVASLIVLGGIVLSGRALTIVPAVAIFAAFGLFHGSAFGGSISGQEGGIGGSVMLGYFIGLAVLQYGIAIGAGYVAEKLLGATEATAINARLVGAMIAGVGIFLALEIAEGPLVAMISAAA